MAGKPREILIVLYGSNPFDLSREGWRLFAQLKALSFSDSDFQVYHNYEYQKRRDSAGRLWDSAKISRSDPTLLTVVRQLGTAATNWCDRLGICELPRGAKYEIREGDNYSRDSAGYRDGGCWETLYELKDGWERKVEPTVVIKRD